jgi:cytoskeletal protein RodZ
MLRPDPILPDMTKEDAIKIRETRRARVRLIRARVVGGSVALFLAVWSLIAVVLITGHDPALARKTLTTSAATGSATTATTATPATSATSTTPSTSATSSTSSGSSGATSSSTGADTSGQSPVTSSQS